MGSWRGAKRHEGSCSGCCCPSRVETQKNTRTGVVSRDGESHFGRPVRRPRADWRFAASGGARRRSLGPPRLPSGQSRAKWTRPCSQSTRRCRLRRFQLPGERSPPRPGAVAYPPPARPPGAPTPTRLIEKSTQTPITYTFCCGVDRGRQKTRCAQLKWFECLDLRLLKP